MAPGQCVSESCLVTPDGPGMIGAPGWAWGSGRHQWVDWELGPGEGLRGHHGQGTKLRLAARTRFLLGGFWAF